MYVSWLWWRCFSAMRRESICGRGVSGQCWSWRNGNIIQFELISVAGGSSSRIRQVEAWRCIVLAIFAHLHIEMGVIAVGPYLSCSIVVLEHRIVVTTQTTASSVSKAVVFRSEDKVTRNVTAFAVVIVRLLQETKRTTGVQSGQRGCRIQVEMLRRRNRRQSHFGERYGKGRA
ncbi:hypothetical protein BKA61DRAFT_26843 [Leptodontidium sp. MPI-SDFR-AT-0119]|nr:hypothetical protein BKA61DRAFT_26843 [Leptodontidium sp. MPI-SDFR-AT-0119]